MNFRSRGVNRGSRWAAKAGKKKSAKRSDYSKSKKAERERIYSPAPMPLGVIVNKQGRDQMTGRVRGVRNH